MGQNKMEKEFRIKLNQREIAPTPNAWDRLDAMLTIAEEKKPKRDFGWLYIAASVVGFLFVGAIYLSQTEEIVDLKRNEVVLQNQKHSEITPTATKEKSALTQDSQSIASVSNGNIQTTQSSSKIKINQNSPIHVITQTKKEEFLAATQTSGRHKAAESISNTIINQKTEQLTTAKVDELLANAEPVQNSGTAKPSVKVDSKSLLSQVDGELNLSFREKMLRKINKNYQEVAEAVSTRNIEQ